MTALWIAMIVYLAGFLASVRKLAEDSLDLSISLAEGQVEIDKIRYPHSWKSHHPYGDGPLTPSLAGRRRAVWCGAARALIWPATVPAMLFTRNLVSAIERERAAEREAKRIEHLAESMGLSFLTERGAND